MGPILLQTTFSSDLLKFERGIRNSRDNNDFFGESLFRPDCALHREVVLFEVCFRSPLRGTGDRAEHHLRTLTSLLLRFSHSDSYGSHWFSMQSTSCSTISLSCFCTNCISMLKLNRFRYQIKGLSVNHEIILSTCILSSFKYCEI